MTAITSIALPSSEKSLATIQYEKKVREKRLRGASEQFVNRCELFHEICKLVVEPKSIRQPGVDVTFRSLRDGDMVVVECTKCLTQWLLNDEQRSKAYDALCEAHAIKHVAMDQETTILHQYTS